MKKTLSALAVALAATTFLPQAQAATLSFTLSPATDVAFGGAVGVDIFVNGLTQAVGAFAFDLNYDSSRISFGSFVADPNTKMGDGANPAIDLSGGNSGSLVNFNVLSGFVLPVDEATLAGLQGTGFRLGRADFTALTNAGYADFGLSGFSLSNYDGFDIPVTGPQGAQLCVSPNGTTGACATTTPIPEPTMALLAGIALGGLFLSRRRQQKAT